MAFSVNPSTHVITIPQVDLTFISGTLYELNTDTFRKSLKAWEDDVEGIIQQKTHNHNTEVSIVGITYARSIAILAPYSITFEDGQYTVILKGSNNNIFDVAGGILNQNQVQVIPTNSAGLIVNQEQSISEQDKLDIADRVWDEDAADHVSSFSEGSLQTHMIYNGAVHLDPLSSNTGTAFPVGTAKVPVNNLTDAKAIADNHAMETIHLMNNLVIGAAENVSDYTISSPHYIDVMVTLTGGCLTQNTRFANLIIGGTFNGKCKIEDSTILELIDFKGFMLNCVLVDNVAVTDPTTPTLIHNCGAGKVSPRVEIDLNNASVSLGGWKGALKLVNKTGTTTNLIEIMSGSVEIDSTCVAGTIVVKGIGRVTDNSGAGCTVITTNLMNTDLIADTIWDEDVTIHNNVDSTGKLIQDSKKGIDDTQALIFA